LSITINVPDWGIWLLVAMLAITSVVQAWNAIEIRRYRSAFRRAGGGGQ
jgi:hypothetical protein